MGNVVPEFTEKRMPRTALLLLALATLSVLPARADGGASLRGSPASMLRQNEIARESDYTFLRTPDQVREFAAEGFLVPLRGNADYQVAAGVSFPFARPETRTFLERLSAQHRDACGEKLVVTSLTRPQSGQPSNSHALSVHPTGMAVDLRIHPNQACREWLEDTLLSLEKQELLDVTREQRPPHYHVAVFPEAYTAYLAGLRADSVRAVEEARVAATPVALPPRTTGVRHASTLPPMHRAAESDSGGGLWLAVVALAPLGLALGLRRGPG